MRDTAVEFNSSESSHFPPPLNSNPQSLYWPTRRCPSLPCPPLTNLQPHGSSLASQSTPRVGFCLRTLPPIFCLGLSALNFVLPQSHSDLCPEVPSLRQPCLTIPSIAPTQDYFLRCHSSYLEMCNPSPVFLYVALDSG